MIALVVALLLCLSSCGGGEVHFVSDKQVAPPPVPPPTPPKTVVDHFVYGQPTGDVIILFDFYPRKTMASERVAFTDLASHFTSAYWLGAGAYGMTSIGVARDIAFLQPTWFTYDSAAPDTATPEQDSLTFLKSTIPAMPGDYSGEGLPVTPVDGLVQTAQALPAPPEPGKRPVWIHFVDLRNLDFPQTPQEQNAASEARQNLTQALDRDSFSPFRFQFYLFAFLRTSACESAQSDQLLDFLSAYPTKTFDLCQLSSTGDGSVLEQLATAIHADQERLVLSRVPHLETLSVTAAGRNIPRQLLRFNSGANEIMPTMDAAIHVGDPIEVTYETD